MSKNSGIDEGEGFLQKSGPIFGKKCAHCGSRFHRFWNTNFFTLLAGIIFFGGTSKYCKKCREKMLANSKEKQKVDKGFLFRVIWFVVAVFITYLLVKLK